MLTIRQENKKDYEEVYILIKQCLSRVLFYDIV